MDIKRIFEKASESGFSASEVYISENIFNEVSTCDGEIDSYKIHSSKVIGFRGLLENVIGWSYSEKFDDSVVDQLIKTAKEKALLLTECIAKEYNLDIIYKGSDEEYTKIEEKDKEIVELTMIELENMTLELDSKLRDKVYKVESATISTRLNKIQLINSYGVNLQEEKTSIMATISAVLKKSDNEYVSGFSGQKSTHIQNIDLEKIADKAYKNAFSQLQAVSVESGKYKVILENAAFSILFFHMRSLFFCSYRDSKLKGLENTQIANRCITVEDDPHFVNSTRSRGFDAEGVRTYKKTLIENGIFKGFLHNLSTASANGAKSTGNASKSSSGSIDINSTNLIVKAGELSIEQLIEKANNGLYITNFTGISAGIDIDNGDFSLSAKGLIIENGRISRGVNQIVISGNFLELLKNITDIANDFSLLSIGTASVLVSELSVAGE